MRASRVRKPLSRRLRLEVGAELLQGAGQAQRDGAGLAVLAAATDVDEDVEPAAHLGARHRGANVVALDLEREIDVDVQVLTTNLPVPSRIRTRATAVLRRPVPQIYGF